MTAEIAVANKTGVALAADSKVTIGGGRNAKNYDSVNKVFTLSKTSPVGIMIFGNAEFMDYPWETIIKLYRRERGSISKNYISDWSDDFKIYIEQFGTVEKHHRVDNIQSIVATWLYELEELASTRASASGCAHPSPEYDNILIDTIKDFRERILVRHESWLSSTKAKSVLKRYESDIVEAIKDAFRVDEGSELFNSALALSAAVLTLDIESPRSSGFVIAGFGEKEFFPTVIENVTDGFIGNNLKIRSANPKDISRTMPGYVGAFAQKDTVQNFMNGFDPHLILKMTGSLNEIMTDSCLGILDAYGLKSKKTDRVKGVIKEAVQTRVEELIQDFINESKQHFSGPVVEMVSLLPKEELAHLAESLVALTSLRRRVSREAETVGGPIDVALISKGDGFVWIKRKHYFKAELNPQFVQTYMDDARRD